MDLLRQTGLVEYGCVLPFDEQRQRETVDDFVINNLVRRLGMRILVVGENFACGRGRKGDLAYLSALGEQFGFTVQPQPLHAPHRSEEHTSELQSLMRISYAVFCLKKKKKNTHTIR